MIEFTFIYSLLDPRTKLPRYVGKANDPSSRYGNFGANEPSHKGNWVKSLRKLGLKPIIEVIDKVPFEEWKFWEKHYISLYKSWGFDLTNTAEGGHGGNTGPCSEETRKKLSLSKKGDKNPRKKGGQKF